MEKEITVTLNGEQKKLTVEPRLLLVHLIRENLNQTGTHIGCDTSHCGACTVLLDGRSVKSCTILAVQANGKKITTVEGLATAEGLHVLQEGFKENHALQCGFCTPGILMSFTDYLARDPKPTEEALREVLSGHICRCTGYAGIMAALKEAAGLGAENEEQRRQS
jgi:aerobic-type carbon monoxide dehydrogenase small subunit (CoxS/CutS family)